MSIVIGQVVVNTYSTPTDVSKLLNITFTTTTVPTTDQVTDLIIRADAYINQTSGHNWQSQQWVEQHDAIGTGMRAGTILPRNRPIITVDKVEYWDGGSKTWIAGVSGFPEDAPDKQTYYVYSPEGKIVWHKLRLDQRLRYRVTYTWGYTTVPDFVRDLSSAIAARDVLLFWGSQLGLQEDISQFKKRLDEKIFRLEARATQRTAVAVG